MPPNPSIPIPVLAACSVLVWIPVGVCFVSLVHWMVTGEIETFAGLILLFCMLSLGILTVMPPYPIASPILCGVAWTSMMAYPALRRKVIAHQLALLDAERMHKAYRQLDGNLNNIGAKIIIAETLHERGWYGVAVAVLEAAIQGQDPQFFGEQISQLKRWKVNPQVARQNPTATCHRCGHRNPAGAVYCKQCRERYLVELVASTWSRDSAEYRLMTAWGALALLGALIPAITRWLTGTIALVAIFLVVIAAGAAILKALIRFTR